MGFVVFLEEVLLGVELLVTFDYLVFAVLELYQQAVLAVDSSGTLQCFFLFLHCLIINLFDLAYLLI